MAETQHTFCRICESLCGLEVDVEDGRAVAIRPDAAHVATDGFSCIKGLNQHHMYDSPDRLRFPEKRVGDRWERSSWDGALGEIGATVKRLIAEDGPDAVAMYVGTAAGFSMLHPVFANGFMAGLGSRSLYASATQDCANKFAVAKEIYGFPFTQPFPDIDRTQCLVIVGANPAVSKWSFLQVPNPIRRLRDIQARGGKVIVVDPRRTETAKVASQHVFIRPDTDVFFYLSFLNELIASGGVDRERCERFMKGAEQVAELAAPWTPERTAEVTGIDPRTLREIVATYREADGASLYCSTGVNMGTNGSLAFWLQEVINAVSGNLDRSGGSVVGHGVFDFARFGVRTGMFVREDTSRIGGFRAVNDAFPGGVLADEILTPGAGRVRALFVTGGNPLITMANAGRLREAFKDLELLVVLDIYRNETASLAHYVLPCTSPLERPDLPFAFPLFMGMQSRPYLQATKRVVKPDGEQRDESTIYLDLCRASGVSLYGSRIAQKTLEAARRVHSWRHPEDEPALPQEAILSLLLRVTRTGSFRKLLSKPHGVLRPERGAGDFLGERVVSADGRIDLAPSRLMAGTTRLDADFERRSQEPRGLRLITKRAHKTHNSWTHNIESFVSGGGQNTNHLFVHPDDAGRLGLAEGDIADVTSRTGTVRVPVRLLADLMPGTVALPHGWGHQHATGLSVASRTEGVNVNLLAADGPDEIEPISGMAHLTGIPVDVKPAAGPRDPGDWSGIGAD